MQRRLLCCLAGVLVGAGFAPRFSASLDLSLTIGLLAFAAAGGTAGYLASFLFDVFTAGDQT